MIMDTDEQLDEEIHKARSGRIQSIGACFPVELGYVTLLVWMCSTNWMLSDPHTVGVFMPSLLAKYKAPHEDIFRFSKFQKNISPMSPLRKHGKTYTVL